MEEVPYAIILGNPYSELELRVRDSIGQESDNSLTIQILITCSEPLNLNTWSSGFFAADFRSSVSSLSSRSIMLPDR